ncbi:MAG TPA: tetratricopeptide repeat protein [Pyrinomonadaceae bacterium]
MIALSVSVAAQTARQTFEAGTRAAQNAQYESALENYRTSLASSEIEKTNGEFRAKIHFNIGVCLFHLRQTAEAVIEFKKAIALDGDYQKAFYALGMAESESKNWRNAREALQTAVGLKKTDGEAWFDLGLVLTEEKNFEAARAAFENSIRYKTIAATDAHNNIGVIFALKGDFDSAEKEFRAALQLSAGKSVEAQNNLQICRVYRQNSLQTPKLQFSGASKAE